MLTDSCLRNLGGPKVAAQQSGTTYNCCACGVDKQCNLAINALFGD